MELKKVSKSWVRINILHNLKFVVIYKNTYYECQYIRAHIIEKSCKITRAFQSSMESVIFNIPIRFASQWLNLT